MFIAVTSRYEAGDSVWCWDPSYSQGVAWGHGGTYEVQMSKGPKRWCSSMQRACSQSLAALPRDSSMGFWWGQKDLNANFTLLIDLKFNTMGSEISNLSQRELKIRRPYHILVPWRLSPRSVASTLMAGSSASWSTRGTSEHQGALLAVQVAKHCSWLPREVMESSSLIDAQKPPRLRIKSSDSLISRPSSPTTLLTYRVPLQSQGAGRPALSVPEWAGVGADGPRSPAHPTTMWPCGSAPNCIQTSTTVGVPSVFQLGKEVHLYAPSYKSENEREQAAASLSPLQKADSHTGASLLYPDSDLLVD